VIASQQYLTGLRGSIAEALETMPEVIVAYVFGSVARGTATPLSDVDSAMVDSVRLRAVVDNSRVHEFLRKDLKDLDSFALAILETFPELSSAQE
jgi:predicted nucleotidyltransferase